jgi:hypothetical protein
MGVVYDRNRSWIKRLDVAPYSYGTGQQGTDQMFQAEVGQRVGTFYGRAFVRSCSELPAPFNSSANCGGDRTAFQINDEGWLVWVGAGNSWTEGITRNLWESWVPGCTRGGSSEVVCTDPANSTLTAPWGVALHWGMPIILRGNPDNATDAARVALGNALPDFRFAVTQHVRWRALTVYALLDASIGQKVWNEGFHWAHLDFLSRDVDQDGKSVATAKPVGYYYRAAPPDNGSGVGGFYDLLGPNNYTVEDASYAKLRELSVAYHVGRLGGIGDWEVSVTGRNLVTLTGYRGFDPEVGIAGNTNTNISGSRAINAVDAFVFPNLRTFTARLSTTF